MPEINTAKVCYVIVRARELESQDEGVAADASNPTDDKFVSVLTEEAFSTVRQEVGAFIDAMDEDEQCELVALAWVGRGDFSAKDGMPPSRRLVNGASAQRPPIFSASRCLPVISSSVSMSSTKVARDLLRTTNDGE